MSRNSAAKRWTAILMSITMSEFVWADGPFALVAGRWDPSVIVIDLSKALDPANNATPNAIVSRVRVTWDVDTDGDGIRDAPATGLPSNIVIPSESRFAFVVNHAGNAIPSEVTAFPHGHPGSMTVLDIREALDPTNDRTTNAIAAVVSSGGYGPVGVALTTDGQFALVSHSEGAGGEDGGREISMIDIGRGEVTEVLQMRLGDGGKIPQDVDKSCLQLAAEPSRLPRGLPDRNFGCFPDINAIGISGLHGDFAFSTNGGTDDVSVIDVGRAIEGHPDAEVARISVERGPWGLAVNPGGDLVAVTNRESAETGIEGNTVSIVDVSRAIEEGSEAEVARVLVGTDDTALSTRPFGLAFSPDGNQLVVANFRSNNLSIVDVRSALESSGRAEVVRISLVSPGGGPARPRGVAITPDGRFAAVSGGSRDAVGGGFLWVIDMDAGEVVSTVSGVGNEPYLLSITAGTSDPG